MAGEKVRPLNKVTTEMLRESTDAMNGLVRESLPLQVDARADALWPPVAHGFLPRCANLLDSLTMLVERELPGEAQVMVRVLYEHVTVFCWLAIDPEAHVARWRQWADSRRVIVHEEAKEYGIEVLTPKELSEYAEAEKSPSLPQLAREVDEYWPEHSTAFRPLSEEKESNRILTFSGFYTAIYRKASNIVHADVVSVERFMTLPITGSATIHATEKRSESADYPAIAVPLMAFLLIAFAHHFNWPKREVIDGITNQMMYEERGPIAD